MAIEGSGSGALEKITTIYRKEGESYADFIKRKKRLEDKGYIVSTPTRKITRK